VCQIEEKQGIPSSVQWCSIHVPILFGTTGPKGESAAQAAAASASHVWPDLAVCFERPGVPSDAASAARHAVEFDKLQRLLICKARTAKFRGTPSPSSSTKAPASTTTGPAQKHERSVSTTSHELEGIRGGPTSWLQAVDLDAIRALVATRNHWKVAVLPHLSHPKPDLTRVGSTPLIC
jgi:hypothetical protein